MRLIDADELKGKAIADPDDAALKLKRAMEGTNPTPMSVEECVANMGEEIADVSLLVDLLGYNTREHLLSQGRVAQRKAERWLKRLEDAYGR